MNLAGLELQDLEEGSVPLTAVVVMSVLDPAGKRALFIRYTDELPLWEVTGMLDAALGVTRRDLHEHWIQDGDDE